MDIQEAFVIFFLWCSPQTKTGNGSLFDYFPLPALKAESIIQFP